MSSPFYMIPSSHLFPASPEIEWKPTLPVQWRPQRWPRSEYFAEVVDQARRELQDDLTRSLDRWCASMGLDPFATWRWPHNDEIDRERYRLVLEAKAEAMIAMQIIDPKDYVRVTTVPF